MRYGVTKFIFSFHTKQIKIIIIAVEKKQVVILEALSTLIRLIRCELQMRQVVI
jgi:hypothetical protein